MIARNGGSPCGCWSAQTCNHACTTISTDATTNVTNTNTVRYVFSSYARSAIELDRQLEEFARRAKIKVSRPVVKVDEKKLIGAPARAHAKPHASQSSRAAMSVRQFAQRVK